jgi:tetratricopeptide (TPR) repeat protein
MMGRVLPLCLLFSVLAGCSIQGTQERYDKGLDLLYENRFEDAEIHFLSLARELARNETPENRSWQAKALYQVGRIDHLYLKQPRRAIARYREALKADPQAQFAFLACVSIAQIFQDDMGDQRSAALELEKLVQAFPDHKDIEQYHYRIAQCYFLLHDFNQARTEARLLLEKHPKGQIAAQAIQLVANSYYVEGDYAEAAKAHEQLLSMDPTGDMAAHSLFELGMCQQEMGELEKAEKSFLDVLKTHPNPSMIQSQLASLRERQSNQSEEARGVDGGVAPDGGRTTAPTANPPQPRPPPTSSAPKETAKNPSPPPKVQKDPANAIEPAKSQPAKTEKPVSVPPPPATEAPAHSPAPSSETPAVPATPGSPATNTEPKP